MRVDLVTKEINQRAVWKKCIQSANDHFYSIRFTSISCDWSSITICCCFIVPSSSLFRSSSVLPSSAANWRSVKRRKKNTKSMISACQWRRKTKSNNIFHFHCQNVKEHSFTGNWNECSSAIFIFQTKGKYSRRCFARWNIQNKQYAANAHFLSIIYLLRWQNVSTKLNINFPSFIEHTKQSIAYLKCVIAMKFVSYTMNTHYNYTVYMLCLERQRIRKFQWSSAAICNLRLGDATRFFFQIS